MIKHRFAIGQRVELLPNPANLNIRPGVYTITRALPVSGDSCQYRAKSATEAHERVFDEAQLRPVLTGGALWPAR